MVKILLHRVATHKIHISTNEANFINSQIITISCFSITCLNSIPLYKRKCSHYHYYITSVTNSTIYHKSPSPRTTSGKVPCSITTETHYFWQVSRFPHDHIASLGPYLPSWAIVEVVPWIFAPETCDMTQVFLCRNWFVPGIQSTSLPGLFHSNQGF